jgi:hypothetical protein
MTTIVNSPSQPTEGSNGIGFLIGIVILVAVGAMLFYYGIPAINRMKPIEVSVQAPQIVVPDSVNVNVVQPK